MTRNRTIIYFIIIISMGIFLRTFLCNAPTLWLDEAYTFYESNRPFSEIVKHYGASSLPFFYSICTHFFLKFGTGIFYIRATALIAGILSVIVFYKVTAALFGINAALFTTLLFACHPYEVYYSQDGRPYSLFVLFSLLSFYFFVKFLQKSSLFYLFSLLIVFWLGFNSHYYFVFVIITLNIIMVLFSLRKKITIFKNWFIYQIFFVLTLIPSIFILFNQWKKRGTLNNWLSQYFKSDAKLEKIFIFLQKLFLHFNFGHSLSPESFNLIIIIAVGLTFCLLFCIPLLSEFRKYQCGEKNKIENKDMSNINTGAWVLSLYFLSVVPVLISLIIFLLPRSEISPRYVICSHPFYIMLCGYGLYKCRNIKFKYTVFAICLSAYLFSVYNLYYNPVHKKGRWNEIVNFVESRSAENDIFIFVSGLGFPPYRYLSKKNIANKYIAIVPDITTFDNCKFLGWTQGDFNDVINFTENKAESGVWVISSVPFYADPQNKIRDYLNSHFHRKFEKYFKAKLRHVSVVYYKK